jgi:hypothetical protein
LPLRSSTLASTIYALRNQELKNRYTNNKKSKDPSFETQRNALWHLANTKRLSRHGCIWLGKAVNEMFDAWPGTEHQAQIEELRDRQVRAWRRFEARIAEKAAAKASTGTSKRTKKSQPITQAPVPPPQEYDPWENL